MPPDSPLGTLADVSAPPGPAAQIVAEERSVFLPTRELALEVWLGEQRLSFFINGNRDRVPHIEQLTSAGVSIRLTDWVGRLPFRLVYEDSEEVQEVVVYPAKLSRTPGTAFAALARMVAELPELQRRLHFEGGDLPEALSGVQTLWTVPLRAQDLLELAGEAWQLWQLARRQPRPAQSAQAGRARERVVLGGQVPDRVDWNRTLDLWGRGEFPHHVALDLPAPQPPPALAALRELWQALEEAAAQLAPGPERDEVQRRFARALAEFPRPDPASTSAPARHAPPARDPLSRRAAQLTAEVRSLTRPTSGLPGGRVRMAELYEFWAQMTLARVFGAVQGELSTTADGLYTGTLRSETGPLHSDAEPNETQPWATVSLNPRLMFSGIGSSSQTLQPDLLAVLGQGAESEVVVADVKYRPLDRLGTDHQREINDQLLRYMGLTHAATGLVLWPGSDPEADLDGAAPPDPTTDRRLSILPGGRARLVRLRLHPLDPPHHLDDDLRDLGLLPERPEPLLHPED
ncbi:hypothetical protein [Deinococcus sp. PESE-13]